jgi:hypothetical protein
MKDVERRDPRKMPSDRRPLGFWRLAAFIYLTVQIAVPAIMLARPRPARFGWQMFAGLRSLETYSVVRRDASTELIQLSSFFGNPRLDTEIDMPAFLLRICARRPDATAVRFKNALSGKTRDYVCERD